MMGCIGSTIMVPQARELTLEASDGISLAAQSWKSHPASADKNSSDNYNNELRILCLHGWMDNCRSFHLLAPGLISQLEGGGTSASTSSSGSSTGETTTNASANHASAQRKVHVVALDLPGHGLSSHRSNDAPPMIRAEYLFYVAEAVRLLKWWDPLKPSYNNSKSNNNPQPFWLIGHSMGAGIALLYAAAFPEQIKGLVLLDSTGQMLANGGVNNANISQQLRAHVTSRQRDGPFMQQPTNRFYYPSLEAAVKVRCRSW